MKSSSSSSTILERISELERGLLPAIAIKGEPVTKNELVKQMERYAVPAISIAVINDGTIEWAKSY